MFKCAAGFAGVELERGTELCNFQKEFLFSEWFTEHLLCASAVCGSRDRSRRKTQVAVLVKPPFR
jgi:hypothetical protein